MAVGENNDFLCKVCGEAITFASGGVSCRRCATLHHRSCWEYVGRCSVYACDEIRFVVGDVDALSGSSCAVDTGAGGEATADRAAVPAVRASSCGGPVPAAMHRGSIEQILSAAVLRGTLYCPDCHAVNPMAARVCAFCEFPVAKAALIDPTLPARKSTPPVPVVITVVRSLDRIAAGLVALAGLALITHGTVDLLELATSAVTHACLDGRSALAQAMLGVCFLFLSVLLHLVGSFYEMGSIWARRAQLPLSLALVVSFPIGTIFGLAMLACWLAPSAAGYFRRQVAPVPLLTS